MPVSFKILIIAFLAALVSGCNHPSEPIRIGLSVNLSGAGGAAGEDIRNGVMLAVSEINEKGDISGRPLELFVRDDRNTAQGVMDADQDLIAKGVIAIIGHTTSENTLTAHPFVTSHGVLLFTPYSATSRLSGKDDLFLRTAVDTRLYGMALGRTLEEQGVKSAAFLLDMSNESYCEEYLAETKKTFSGSIHTVRINSREAISWDEAIQQLMQGNPGAVVLLTEVLTTGIAAQKLRLAGYCGDLYATIWAQTPALRRFGGDAVEGLRIISFVPPMMDAPFFLDFNQKMMDKFGSPASARSIRAYEAVMILSEAIGKCLPEPTSACLKKALVGHEFNGCLGPVRFDAFGDTLRPVYEIELSGGKERLIKEILR